MFKASAQILMHLVGLVVLLRSDYPRCRVPAAALLLLAHQPENLCNFHCGPCRLSAMAADQFEMFEMDIQIATKHVEAVDGNPVTSISDSCTGGTHLLHRGIMYHSSLHGQPRITFL